MNHLHIAPATDALATLSQDPAARELARQRRLAELDYLSGLDEARAEGKAEGLREAIRQLCHLLEIDLDFDGQQRLARSTVEELLALQEAVFKHRSWPEHWPRHRTIAEDPLTTSLDDYPGWARMSKVASTGRRTAQ